MRLTVEPTDREPVLGPPIRNDKPAPAPVPVAPGIVRRPDGTLGTVIAPPPPAPAKPLPVVHIDDDACDLKSPTFTGVTVVFIGGAWELLEFDDQTKKQLGCI